MPPVPAVRSPQEAIEDFKQHTLGKLDGLRCPVHRQAPRVDFHGTSLRTVSIRMSGCCDALIALANQKIGSCPARSLLDAQRTRCDIIAPNMTVCIAAICEGGNNIVIAADRMFTAGPPLNLEFEPPLSKIEKLADACVGMASGNSLFAAEMLDRVRGHLKQNTGGKNPKVLQVANFAKDVYTKFRNEKIGETLIGAHLGPDFAIHSERGTPLPTYLKDQPGMYQNMVIQTNNYNLGVEVTIAGCEESTSHIYYLANPGTVASFDKLGYNAIGSGAIHAMVALHLGSQSPKSSLAATLSAVYGAKIAAEVAPGVGEETEIGVLSKGAMWMCPQALIDGLKEIRKESIQKTTPDLEKVQNLYDKQRGSGSVSKG